MTNPSGEVKDMHGSKDGGDGVQDAVSGKSPGDMKAAMEKMMSGFGGSMGGGARRGGARRGGRKSHRRRGGAAKTRHMRKASARRKSLSRRRSMRRRVKSSACRKKGPAVCRSMSNCKFVSKKRRYCRKSSNTRRRSRGGARRGGRKSRRRRGGLSAAQITPFALTAALFAKKRMHRKSRK